MIHPDTINRFIKGDEQALKVIMGEYTPLLYGILTKQFRSLPETDIEDIISISFTKLWENRERVNVSAKSLLCRIAINQGVSLCIKYAREKNKYKRFGYLCAESEETIEPSNEICATEILGCLSKAAVRTKDILVLRLCGYSVKQIATVMKISPDTIRNLLIPAYKKIKRTLTPSLS